MYQNDRWGLKQRNFLKDLYQQRRLAPDKFCKTSSTLQHMEIFGQLQHCTILNKMYLNDRKIGTFS